MDPTIDINAFLEDIRRYGNQQPIRLRHRKELYNDLCKFVEKENKF